MPVNTSHLSAERRLLVTRYRSVRELYVSFGRNTELAQFMTESAFCRLSVMRGHMELQRVINIFNGPKVLY